MWVVHCKGHILRQVVKAHPFAMLLGGSQTLCCHLNCKLVPQLAPMTGKDKNKQKSQGRKKPGQLVGVAICLWLHNNFSCRCASDHCKLFISELHGYAIYARTVELDNEAKQDFTWSR